MDACKKVVRALCGKNPVLDARDAMLELQVRSHLSGVTCSCRVRALMAAGQSANHGGAKSRVTARSQPGSVCRLPVTVPAANHGGAKCRGTARSQAGSVCRLPVAVLQWAVCDVLRYLLGKMGGCAPAAGQI